jgi:hypothetical protein
MQNEFDGWVGQESWEDEDGQVFFGNKTNDNTSKSPLEKYKAQIFNGKRGRVFLDPTCAQPVEPEQTSSEKIRIKQIKDIHFTKWLIERKFISDNLDIELIKSIIPKIYADYMYIIVNQSIEFISLELDTRSTKNFFKAVVNRVINGRIETNSSKPHVDTVYDANMFIEGLTVSISEPDLNYLRFKYFGDSPDLLKGVAILTSQLINLYTLVWDDGMDFDENDLDKI